MINWKENIVQSSATVQETIEVIDRSAVKIVLVVDSAGRLEGTVTDGDIRRGILRKVDFSDSVAQIMKQSPTVATISDSKEEIFKKMQQLQHRYMPLLDGDGHVIGLEALEELIAEDKLYDNWVVLMAGGLGQRLRPLTDNVPKPLLRLGSKPLLETIINNFRQNGFRKFFLSVNYRGEMVEEYFGDGSKWGIEIQYLREDKKMGTAGSLSLLPEKPTKPVVVMNGDLLTKVDFRHLIDFHSRSEALGTMCVREYDFQVPFGVVQLKRESSTDENIISSIDEKPNQQFFINAGIYVLDPKAIELVPQDNPFDMTSLFQKIIESGQRSVAFPVREYWLDIGQLDDFQRAQTEYPQEFE